MEEDYLIPFVECHSLYLVIWSEMSGICMKDCLARREYLVWSSHCDLWLFHPRTSVLLLYIYFIKFIMNGKLQFQRGILWRHRWVFSWILLFNNSTKIIKKVQQLQEYSMERRTITGVFQCCSHLNLLKAKKVWRENNELQW